eukprot:834153-Heterocapsa_arctica.AAC.1
MDQTFPYNHHSTSVPPQVRPSCPQRADLRQPVHAPIHPPMYSKISGSEGLDKLVALPVKDDDHDAAR